MSTRIECPGCGETDKAHLRPNREGQRITITCESCGTAWERTSDTCPECGAKGLVPKRMPLLQKARGTQQSIIGYWMARQCNSCGWSSAGPADTSAVS